MSTHAADPRPTTVNKTASSFSRMTTTSSLSRAGPRSRCLGAHATRPITSARCSRSGTSETTMSWEGPAESSPLIRSPSSLVSASVILCSWRFPVQPSPPRTTSMRPSPRCRAWTWPLSARARPRPRATTVPTSSWTRTHSSLTFSPAQRLRAFPPSLSSTRLAQSSPSGGTTRLRSLLCFLVAKRGL